MHIYTSTRQEWLNFADDIPSVEEYYDKKEYWRPESLERFERLMGR